MAAAVSVPSVEQLLAALAHERRDRGGISTTSLNVIAFVENDEALLQWLSESSDAFAEAHGFRVILLDGSHTPESHSVRTRCKEFSDTLVTSLEQVQLGTEGIAAAELRSIAHDLLVPSVRSVMLWGGRYVKDERFFALSELADTIVLFSPGPHSALESLRQLARFEDPAITGRIRDLAYMRLLAWQDLIAQFFDDPELAAELPHIARIEITSGSEPEAYYLAGWLASRLGWQPCAERAFRSGSGTPVEAEFRREGMPRRIRAVYLHARNCTFGVCISPDAEDLICLTVEGRKSRPLRCVPLHDVDIVSLVERAIFAPADGGVFIETLALLRRLFEWEKTP